MGKSDCAVLVWYLRDCQAAFCALDVAGIAFCLSQILLSSVALLCNVLY